MATLTMDGYRRMRETAPAVREIFDAWLDSQGFVSGSGHRVFEASFGEGVMRVKRYCRGDDGRYVVLREPDGTPIRVESEEVEVPISTAPPAIIYDYCD